LPRIRLPRRRVHSSACRDASKTRSRKCRKSPTSCAKSITVHVARERSGASRDARHAHTDGGNHQTQTAEESVKGPRRSRRTVRNA